MPFLKIKYNKFVPHWKISEEATIRNGFRLGVYDTGKSGEKYIGEFQNDKKHGKGIQIFDDGTMYEGDWADGKRNGHGILSRSWCGGPSRQRIYTGLWKNNKPTGFGLRLSDSGVYEGEFKNGLRHGVGSMYYKNGEIYLGKWFKDKRDGIGRLVNATNGNFYEGQFKNEMKCGRGRYFHLNTGQIQEGVWYLDQAQVTVMRDDAKRRPYAIRKSQYPIPPLGLKNAGETFNLMALEVMELVNKF